MVLCSLLLGARPVTTNAFDAAHRPRQNSAELGQFWSQSYLILHKVMHDAS